MLDEDGHRQDCGDEGVIAEPGVERGHKDDALHKVVEGGNGEVDRDGDGAGLVVNNGNAHSAKGASHQIGSPSQLSQEGLQVHLQQRDSTHRKSEGEATTEEEENQLQRG